MTRDKDEPLKRLLGDWLDRRERDADRDALAERIARALADAPPRPRQEGTPVTRPQRANRALAAVAVVAVVLLLALVWQVRNLPSPSPPEQGDNHAEELLGQLDADELERRLALLDQLDELFEERWQWMVECGDRVEMHVGERSARAAAGPFAVRLAVLVRDDSSEAFRVQEKTFVLTREEQAVEAVMEDGVSRRLYFWAFPVDNELFAYDVDLETGKPDDFAISSSGVVAAGRPTKILSFAREGKEYRVHLLLVPGRGHGSRGEKRHL